MEDSAWLPRAAFAPPASVVSATPALIAGALSGDRAAADELIGLHRQRLEVAVRSAFPRELRPVLDAEDLVQTVLHKAINSLHGFRYTSSGSFLRWLVTIAVNALRDELKRHRGALRDLRRTTHIESASGDADACVGQGLAAQQATPSQHAIGNEARARLEHALDQMEPQERELLVDVLLLGADFDEIAVRSGRSREAVRVAVFRAKAKLAAWFEG